MDDFGASVVDRWRRPGYRRRVHCLGNTPIKPLRPESFSAIYRASRLGGNDASVHRLGRQCRRVVDDTRDTLLRWLGVSRRDVVFCGSMREANTLAALGLAKATSDVHKRRTVVLTCDAGWDGIASVLQRHGFVVLRLKRPVVGAVAAGDVALVCVSWICEATGRLRDLRPWRALARESGAWWHVDAGGGLAQAAPDACFEDTAAVTVGSTPLGGPSGVAALVLMRGISPAPLWGGGGQQRGARSGTAATPQVAGFGAAIVALQQESRGAA